MSYPKRTKKYTLILTISVLIISWTLGYFFLEQQFKVSTKNQIQKIYNSVDELFNLHINHETKKFGLELEKIVSLNGISEALATNDHDRLHTIISVYYKNFKKVYNDIKILTFRSKDGITIYRAHRPDFYGDSLNIKRKLIVDTNRLQQSLHGFEVGKLEMTYRITQPIFHNDIYIGNVEIGLDPVHFINDLNGVFSLEMGLIINSSLLDIMINRDALLINKDYALISQNKRLREHFSQNIQDDILKIKMDTPLKNHLSDILGYLIVGFDTSEITKQNKDFMHRLFFIMVIMMLILGFVLHHGFEKILKYFTKQIYTDHLTGLQNRIALNDELFSDQGHILILSDIKEFSIVNELYGVDVGNEVLIQIGSAFKRFADENHFDTFRISSDEFVLLKVADDFEEHEYDQLLDNLHNYINSLTIHVDKISDSINIEIHSGITYDHSHALEDAKMALKKAKKSCLPYLAYTEHVNTKQHSKKILDIKKTVRHALENNNVIPYFQPITDVKGNIIKYEALVRIIESSNGKKNVLTPNMFLDISIENGLYIGIAKEMVKQSLSIFTSRNEKISINLLPNDLFNSSIINLLVEYIEEFGSAEKIVIEITEQESIEDYEKVLKVIKMLRELGVLIAIDDFGSGYANYSHILTIKPDYIKIDGSLIQNILTNDESKILVKSIIHFAKDLNITTVAEYVENENIFELLKGYGVDEFQGYYFGKPSDILE